MLGWIARELLTVAGFMASWFVAKDAPQFGCGQMAVGLLLFDTCRVGPGILARTLDPCVAPGS